MNPTEYQTMFRVEERYWWYRGMRRIARRFAPGLYRLDRGERVLDVGCGTGANLSDMAPPEGGVVGVGLDLSLEGLLFCRRRGLTRMVLGTAERLPFRPETFHALSSRDVLVSLPDDVLALREIARVSRRGATVYLTAAALRAFRGDQDVATHAIRRYSAPELRRKAGEAGLRVERDGYANFLLSPAIFLVRRVRSLLLPERDPLTVRSEFHLAPGPLNGLFSTLLGIEAALLPFVRFPFGVTTLLRASKPLD